MRNNLIFLIIFLTNLCFGQSDSTKIKTKRIGLIGSFDYAYNFQDKVLSPGIGRKWTIGLSITNKKRQFILFIGAGFKGFKINLYSPSFQSSFIQDVQNNYVPISGLSEDSLVGATMGKYDKQNLSGTYSQFFQVGFILNKKLKPSFTFYFGNEEFLLHNHGFSQFEDPKYKDIDYVGMRTTFYEFKLGCALPFKRFSQKPFCLNLNVGYKYIDYGSLKFNNTPLSAYTANSLENKYRSNGKLTISLSFILWSNWK